MNWDQIQGKWKKWKEMKGQIRYVRSRLENVIHASSNA